MNSQSLQAHDVHTVIHFEQTSGFSSYDRANSHSIQTVVSIQSSHLSEQSFEANRCFELSVRATVVLSLICLEQTAASIKSFMQTDLRQSFPAKIFFEPTVIRTKRGFQYRDARANRGSLPVIANLTVSKGQVNRCFKLK